MERGQTQWGLVGHAGVLTAAQSGQNKGWFSLSGSDRVAYMEAEGWMGQWEERTVEG